MNFRRDNFHRFVSISYFIAINMDESYRQNSVPYCNTKVFFRVKLIVLHNIGRSLICNVSKFVNYPVIFRLNIRGT